MLQWLHRLLAGLDTVVAAVAGLMLLGITVTLFANSVARFFIGISFVGSSELALFLMVWLTFLGSYLLVRLQRHVRVDILLRALPQGATGVLNCLISLVGALLLGYVTYVSWGLTYFVLDSGQMMSSLPIRRGWTYLAVSVGCTLMTLAYVIQLGGGLFGWPAPDPARFGLPVDDAVDSTHDKA